MGMEKTIEKVVYPFFEKIGLLWMTGHVLPAHEHFCSYLIQKTVIAATNALPANYGSDNKVVLFTPEREMHELPLLFIQYLMKKKGIKNVLLGKNVSVETIKDYCAHQPASHLYFHLITNLTNYSAEEYIGKLSATFANKKIIASGRAVKEIKKIPANVKLLYSLQEVLFFEL